MKLFHCLDCDDILLVRSVSRACVCGSSHSRLLSDGKTVMHDGPSEVLDVPRRMFDLARIEGRGTLKVVTG